MDEEVWVSKAFSFRKGIKGCSTSTDSPASDAQHQKGDWQVFGNYTVEPISISLLQHGYGEEDVG